MKIVQCAEEIFRSMVPKGGLTNRYKDGLFVQAAASHYEDLVGGKVLEIGKVATQQALDALSEIVWRDNEMGIRAAAPTLISIPEILHALKITDNLTELRLTVEKGGKKQIVVVKPTGEIFHLFQTTRLEGCTRINCRFG